MRGKSASITVYLALVLCLLLSILTIMIESARVSVSKIYIRRVLNTAMKSAMGEYHLPLYENYHLFGYSLVGGEQDDLKEGLISTLKVNMEDNFQPKSNHHLLQSALDKNFLIIQPNVDQIQLKEWNTLVKNNGEVLKGQAIHYQKYSTAGDILEIFFDKLNLLDSTEENIELLQKKFEVEESLSEIDVNILSLMQYIDGIATNSTGVKQNNKGIVQTVDVFAKRIISQNAGSESKGINHPGLHEAVRKKYEDPIERMEELLSLGEETIVQKETYERLVQEVEETRWMLEELGAQYPFLMAKLTVEKARARSAYHNALKEVKKRQEELKKLLKETKAGVEEAIDCLEFINNTKRASKKQVTSYIDILFEKEEILSKEHYEELKADAHRMLDYTDETASKLGIVANVKQMEVTLKNNLLILEEAIDCLSYPFSSDAGEYLTWRNSCSSSKDILMTYSHEGLDIDYSGVRLSKKENSVINTLESMISSGLAGLVMEEEGKSSKSITEESIISTQMLKDSKKFTEWVVQWITKAKEGLEGINAVFESGLPVRAILQSKAEALIEDLLFISYMEEHFLSYEADQSKTERKETNRVLDYEREYILYGNLKDRENLDAAASHIIMIRTILNLVHVLSDSQKTETAHAFALAVLGITGLPFLVSLTKFIILFVWALEAALIETAAILLGKEVPLLATSENFPLTFIELFSMTKENIRNKAKNYTEKKQQVGFEYKDYIRLFLLFQEKRLQNYRSMDLIQANLKSYWDSDFLITQCITDFKVQADIHVPQVFFSLPFIKQKEISSIKGYVISLEEGISY